MTTALRSLLVRRRELLAQRATAIAALDREIDDIDRRIAGLPEALVEVPPPSAAVVAARPRFKSMFDYLPWAIVRTGGVLDYRQCALELFGVDSPRNRQRIYRSLTYLQRSGKIVRAGRRTWQIREQKRLGRPPKPK